MVRWTVLAISIAVMLSGCDTLTNDLRNTEAKFPKRCVPDQIKCNGDKLEQCDTSGYGFVTLAVCPFGCNERGIEVPSCNATCRPGDQRCTGTNLETCSTDGGGYDVTPCDKGCNTQTLTCIEECTPGSKRCVGDALWTCNDAGSGYESEDCQLGCNSTSLTCNSVCRPGEMECDGSDLKTCNNAGDGYNSVTCEFGCDVPTSTCYAKLNANAGANQVIVIGESADLNGRATGGDGTYSCSWSDGTNEVSTDCQVTVTPTETTTYTVTVTDGQGSTATSTVTVNVNPPLAADAGQDQSILADEEVTLNGTSTGGVPAVRCIWPSRRKRFSIAKPGPSWTTIGPMKSLSTSSW